MADYQDITRDLPVSKEAEQSILGCILVEPSCINLVSQCIKREYFAIHQHAEIYDIMLQKFLDNRTIDVVTVLEAVKSAGIFSSEGDANIFITNLVQITITTSNIKEYCDIVREKFFLRYFITKFQDVIEKSRSQSAESTTIIDLAEQLITDIRNDRQNNGFQTIQAVMDESYDRLIKLSGEDRDEYIGIPTGFKDLDHYLGGLNKSDLIILAARPGVGKTSLAVNIATNVAKKGKKVAIFSLEMSNEQVAERIISSEALITSSELRSGMLEEESWDALAAFTSRASNYKIVMDDTSNITIGEIKGKVRREKNISLVIIDYLQLMQGNSGRRSENRVQEISEMTRSLKIMAKELNIPIIVLSQLSRSPEKAGSSPRKPMLSDLRDSGSIEQDADIVIMLHNENIPGVNVTETPGIIDCIIAKNRHGETGQIKLGWDGRHTKFTTSTLNEE